MSTIIQENVMLSRKAAHNVDELIKNRWSSRAMSGELITDEELFSLFEAARWAPSSYNAQPWRFIYAKRGTNAWDVFLDLVSPYNQMWACNAAVLIIIVSRTTFAFNNQPSRTHSFDAGAAWQNLSLQAFSNGLVVRGIGDCDYQRVQEAIQLPAGYAVEVMCAVGRAGNKEDLPEALRAKEVITQRNPIEQWVFEGVFKGE